MDETHCLTTGPRDFVADRVAPTVAIRRSTCIVASNAAYADIP